MGQPDIHIYAEEWCDKHYKRNPEEWTSGYAGFIAGHRVTKQLLNKHDCSKLREIFLAKVEKISKDRENSEKNGLGRAIQDGIIIGLKMGWQMIDEHLPVA